MGGTHLAEDLLKQWLIAPALFDRRVNLLASNDNLPEDSTPEEDIPDVSRLSFY